MGGAAGAVSGKWVRGSRASRSTWDEPSSASAQILGCIISRSDQRRQGGGAFSISSTDGPRDDARTGSGRQPAPPARSGLTGTGRLARTWWRRGAWHGPVALVQVNFTLVNSPRPASNIVFVYLVTKMTGDTSVGLMSRPCRTFVENATPADTHWAIIILPPNEALADPSLPLYSALSLSLPLLSSLPSPLSQPWTAHRTLHVIILSPCLGSELYSPVSYLGNASSFSPNSSNPTRSSLGYQRKKLPSSIHSHSLLHRPSFLLRAPFPNPVDHLTYIALLQEQSVRSLPGSDHPTSTAGLARPHSGPIDRRLPVPPPSDGYRPIVPSSSSSLGYTLSTTESINATASPRASHQPNRPSMSSFQPPQETARLHPVGSATLLPRPSSPSSTISENESPGSDASSQGDLSPDDSLPPIAADKQSDTGRRHACPHCAKRFNRPSSLAIHVNTHTGDKRKTCICCVRLHFDSPHKLTLGRMCLAAFKCPFPNCGREFNVNSNMRRHYRKHLTSTTPQTPRQGSTFYSSQGTPGLGIQIIRYHDHQPDTHPPDVGGASAADSSDTRGPRTTNTRWRAH